VRMNIGSKIVRKTFVVISVFSPSGANHFMNDHPRSVPGGTGRHGAYHSRNCSHRRRRLLREGAPLTNPGRAS
jgi:hypothetical protein